MKNEKTKENLIKCDGLDEQLNWKTKIKNKKIVNNLYIHHGLYKQ